MNVPLFHHVHVVWGRTYTDFFLRFVVPCLLAPGNVPGMASRQRSLFVIYTTEDDAQTMDAAPAIAALRECIRVEFRIIAPGCEGQLAGNVYHAAAVFHREAIRRAADAGAFLTIWSPDAVMSDGTLTSLERRAEQGYDTILVSRLLAVGDDLRPWLERRFAGSARVALTSDEMVEAGRRCFHPFSTAMVWGSERFANRWPSQIWWQDGDDLALVHSWHLHPLMSRPTHAAAEVNHSVDGGYLQLLAYDGWKPLVIRDCAEICFIESTRRDYGADLMTDLGPFDLDRFRAWVPTALEPAHAEIFRHPVIFAKSSVSPARTEALVARAADTVSDLAAEALAQLPPLPALRDPAVLQGTRQLWIYGSGQAGQRLAAKLLPLGIPVAGFLDSTREGALLGLPVRRFDGWAAGRRPGDRVVVASQFLKEIHPALMAAGIEDALDALPLTVERPPPPLDFEIRPWTRSA